MERDRQHDRDDDRDLGLVKSLADVTREPEEIADHEPSRRAAKLMARSDKGRSFAEALEQSMCDHRNVYAALAK